MGTALKTRILYHSKRKDALCISKGIIDDNWKRGEEKVEKNS